MPLHAAAPCLTLYCDTGDLNKTLGPKKDDPVIEKLQDEGYHFLPEHKHDANGVLTNGTNIFDDTKAHVYDCWLVPVKNLNNFRAAAVCPPAEMALWHQLKTRVQKTESEMDDAQKRVFKSVRNDAFKEVSTDHWCTVCSVALEEEQEE